MDLFRELVKCEDRLRRLRSKTSRRRRRDERDNVSSTTGKFGHTKRKVVVGKPFMFTSKIGTEDLGEA